MDFRQPAAEKCSFFMLISLQQQSLREGILSHLCIDAAVWGNKGEGWTGAKHLFTQQGTELPEYLFYTISAVPSYSGITAHWMSSFQTCIKSAWKKWRLSCKNFCLLMYDHHCSCRECQERKNSAKFSRSNREFVIPWGREKKKMTFWLLHWIWSGSYWRNGIVLSLNHFSDCGST